MKILFSPSESKNDTCKEKPIDKSSFIFENLFDFRMQAVKKYEEYINNADLKALQELFGIKNENEKLNNELSSKDEIIKQLKEKARLKAELEKKELEIQQLMKKLNEN